ncbi:Os11g0264500 [Oryza sativa Japonica Group]|uniref:Os11g0264500 protein n=1 Tax=Oryza sativa subsp. japonica TaxID=39947 RepID=Q0ITE9_ORYSJ|nr:Os11g0264500 [Oryza sativa Japonica Group]|eukprot:NP_001067653.1 Os11g0264500 [Oryza sativa Japonica Group]
MGEGDSRLHATQAQAQGQITQHHLKKSSPHNGAVGRILSEMTNRSDSTLSRRIRRVDPLDGLRKYEGGYNITNKHYWSSTIFTGRPGYVIAALWLIGGIIFVGALLISKIFFAKRNTGYGDMNYFLARFHICSMIIFILLAAFVIVASAIAIRGAVRFHSRAEAVKEIIGRTALEATATIYNITEAIEKMQNTSRLYNNNSQAFDHLNSTVKALNSEAVEIQSKAEKNMRLVSKGINILEAVTILTVTLNLFAVLALLVMRPLRLQKLCNLCIAICWILTALIWMYFGLYYFLDEFAGDTCAALEEYQLDPKNSTLGTIIPCSEKFSGSVILHDVGAGIHDIIDQVNSNIYTIKSEYGVKQLDYICNPFAGPPEFRYRPENCPSGAATIGDIPQILRRLTCTDLGGGAHCAPAELSSAIDYGKVETYTSSIQNMLDIFPGTERLLTCELVESGFADIVGRQCAPLSRGARAAWSALAALSAATTALLVLAAAAAGVGGGGGARHAGDDRHSVRHLTSSSNSEISEAEFAEMHAKKVRVLAMVDRA